jgi:hypothetical protein
VKNQDTILGSIYGGLSAFIGSVTLADIYSTILLSALGTVVGFFVTRILKKVCK